MTDTRTTKEAGQARYDAFWAEQLADPEFRRVYVEEAAKKELWLQLVEARQEAGLTQAQMAERLGVSQSQVAKVERHGYEAYTLTTLRRYVQALGTDFALEVQIRHVPHAAHLTEVAGTH
jgi:DNA-binding XRE family transcriptional regulator